MGIDPEGKPAKPLGGKSYGSIPHLPGSRRGPADRGLSEQQARILTDKARDKYDTIFVQEKLDGSNVSAANIGGEIIPITRAGYHARSSPFEMHHHFAEWVEARRARFAALLAPGERLCGEWLMEAHGTRYDLVHEPFVAFDIMRNKHERATVGELVERCRGPGFVTPVIIHSGPPVGIQEVLELLEPSPHGAMDPVEGAVWRCERHGKVDFLGKYVRPEKVDGKYLTGRYGNTEPVYNWRPGA
jgi:hypothetical protein